MRLLNIHIAGDEGVKHIRIEGGRISHITGEVSLFPPSDGDLSLSFENSIVFPGLINSHDHLDFDLFPFLGNGIYPGYHEWGSDIHLTHQATIAAVLKVPRPLRILWGMYKNLLNGVTTVVHHGSRINVPQDLISVWQEASSLHSVSGEKGWRLRLIRPFDRRRPLVIHAGEGTSPAASREIGQLIRWNIFRKPLIAVHGIAMEEKQAASFRGLVWCPCSNENLYHATAPVHLLKDHIPIVFGTDSTLTASWNIFEQLRFARQLRMTEDPGLWEMITRAPADLWGLDGLGSVKEGYMADLVVARLPKGSRGWDAIYSLNPEDLLLVLHNGQVSLFDRSLYPQLKKAAFPLTGFFPVRLSDEQKYVRGDLPRLLDDIRNYYPDVRLPVS